MSYTKHLIKKTKSELKSVKIAGLESCLIKDIERGSFVSAYHNIDGKLVPRTHNLVTSEDIVGYIIYLFEEADALDNILDLFLTDINDLLLDKNINLEYYNE